MEKMMKKMTHKVVCACVCVVLLALRVHLVWLSFILMGASLVFVSF